jgi:hypothetical protein
MKEITETFPISRSALVMHMWKDRFAWRTSGGIYLVDLNSFLDWWNTRREQSLDTSDTSV